jgi:hypothetical protein
VVSMTDPYGHILGLSGFLETIKHSVSETGCFHPQVKEEISTMLGPLERANISRWPSF